MHSADNTAVDTGVDGSSKLAAYLAVGCMSPRDVHEATSASYVRFQQQQEETAKAAGGEKEGGEVEGERWETGKKKMKKKKKVTADWLTGHLEIRDFFIHSCRSMGRRLFLQAHTYTQTRTHVKTQ
jgi:hypothetical protein